MRYLAIDYGLKRTGLAVCDYSETIVSPLIVLNGQKELIKRVRQCYDNPVFVLLDNPFDYELLSPGDTCLTSYGFRRNQIVSLVKVIFGKIKATGNLPFRKEA